MSIKRSRCFRTSSSEKKHKPGSVLLCSSLIIYLCDLPSKTGRAALQFDCSNILGLHGLTAHKVYLASFIAKDCGGLLHPLFTLTRRRFVSVALSVTNSFKFAPGLFTRCGALCSPDFPPRLTGAMKSFFSVAKLFIIHHISVLFLEHEN